MLTLLLIACGQDHYIIDKNNPVYDTGVITEEDPSEPATEVVEEIEEETQPEEPAEEPVEEPIEETPEEEPEEETEEVFEDTGYEEIDEEEELEEEETTPIVTDLYEYGGNYTLVGGSAWPVSYNAVDFGYTEIDSAGPSRTHFVCGLLNGYVDCFCDHNGGYNQCSSYTASDYIPFQQFESLSVGNDSICALDSSGVGLCWDGDGDFFNVPAASDPYSKVLSLSEHYMCALTETGSLFCFDTSTGGLIYSDSNTYKDIDGSEQSVTGVLSDGLTIEYIEIISGYTYTNTPGYEVLGMGAGNYAYCYGGIDQNGMQTVECYERYPISQNNNSHTTSESCLGNAPHQYYYEFFVQGTDLMNIEVTDGKWAGTYDPSTNTLALWGGYYTHNPSWNNPTIYTNLVSSGEWTGSFCNYMWGN